VKKVPRTHLKFSFNTQEIQPSLKKFEFNLTKQCLCLGAAFVLTCLSVPFTKAKASFDTA
jgi:hypothetical protein